MTLKATAAAFSVSPATAHRWWHRWLEAGEEAQADRVLTGRLRLDEDVAVRVDSDRLSAAGAERPRAMRRPSFPLQCNPRARLAAATPLVLDPAPRGHPRHGLKSSEDHEAGCPVDSA
jgi:transposase-like protein